MFETKKKLQVLCPDKIGPYIVCEDIGHGATSIVKRVVHQDTKVSYACKIISQQTLVTEKQHIQFRKEVEILSQIKHAQIVTMYDLLQDALNYYVILEYFPEGTLMEYMSDGKGLPERQAAFLFKQIMEAVKYLHDQKIAHRDIKPSNILIDKRGFIKLIDFGFSNYVNDHLMSTFCGTVSYSSPELIENRPYDGLVSDIWSCGIVLYILVTGSIPWTKSNMVLMKRQIVNADYYIPANLSKECRGLITSMIQIDPAKRLTASQILENDFIRQVRLPEKAGEAQTADLNINYDSFFGNQMVPNNNSYALNSRVIYAALQRKPSLRVQNNINRKTLTNLRLAGRPKSFQSYVTFKIDK